MTWVWIMIALIIVIIAYCIVDYIIGKKNYHQCIPIRDYSKRYGDIHLFTHGKDLFASFLSDIKEAKSSIHILFYIVRNDEFSTRFLHLLIKKAEEGIEVRLLLDWLGSHGVSKALVKKLKDAGGHIAFSDRPGLPFLFFSLQQRNHCKISIIDGKFGYVGGYNIGKEYIDEDPVLSPWRDYHLRIIGESIKDLQTEFFINWKRATGESIIKSEKYFSNLDKGKMLHQFFPVEGIRLEQILCDLIESAKDSIFIGTPYFIPSRDIQQKLIAALKRGINIRIIVPEKEDHLFVKEASFRYFRALIPLGAEVYQYLNGFYHGKIIIIDKELCRIGTANFDRRSLFLNHEINCYIYNQEFILKMLTVVEKDMKDSHLLLYEELANPSFMTKLKELGAKTVEDLL